jgi:uncharacterized membrane protein
VRGPTALHTLEPAAHRVFLLGGQLLYDRGGPADHLAPTLRTELLGRLHVRDQAVPPRPASGLPLDVPCLPTVDGHSQQQWRLYETFYAGYRPEVLVFGVPRDEVVDDPRTARPRSSPAQLAASLRAARAHQTRHGGHVVVLTEHDLPAELSAVLQAEAAAGVPLVVAAAGETSPAIAARLAAVILPLLR